MVFQAQLGVELFQPLVFGFQILESRQLTDLRARVFGFSGVKRGLADAVLAHNVRHGLPALLLLQDSDDLRFAESAHFHEEELKARKLHLSLLSTGLLSGEAYRKPTPQPRVKATTWSQPISTIQIKTATQTCV